MKLFKLLSTLSAEEWQLLRKAVQSPLYNTNKPIIRLMDALRKKHPTYPTTSKFRRQLFKKVFPKEGYAETRLLRLFPILTKIVEQMLLFQANELADFDKKKQLIQIYNERGLTQYFHQETQQLLTHLKDDATLGGDKLLAEYHLLENKYFHPLHNKYDKTDTTLLDASLALEDFYLLEKLRLNLAYSAKKQVLSLEASPNFPSIDFADLEQRFPFSKAILTLFFQACRLLYQPNSTDFLAFEQLFFAEAPHLSRKDQQMLYFAGINTLIQLKNQGSHAIGTYLFKWFQYGLTQNLLIDFNQIPEPIFTNILINAFQLKKYTWAAHFIEDYKQYLPQEKEQSIVVYYKSLLYFTQGNWDKTLYFLNQNKALIVYPPRLRVLKIQTLFEKFLVDSSYWEVLEAHLHAFEVYLRRNTFYSSEKLLPHLNFVKITRQLAKKILAQFPKATIQTWLKTKVADTNLLLAKKWLLEKIQLTPIPENQSSAFLKNTGLFGQP